MIEKCVLNVARDYYKQEKDVRKNRIRFEAIGENLWQQRFEVQSILRAKEKTMLREERKKAE